MQRPPHNEQQGYLTFVVGPKAKDYCKLAYLQALSIKSSQKFNSYAICVPNGFKINKKYSDVFDYVIEVEECLNPFEHEWKAWYVTPFKETFKVESDIIFGVNNDNWWQLCRKNHEILFTSQIRTFRNEIFKKRNKYRQLFSDNELPNIYNGYMYFRYTKLSKTFFDTAKNIFKNFDAYVQTLKNVPDNLPCDTDLVFALAIRELQLEESVINPILDIPTFVHMKPGINDLPETQPWYNSLQFNIEPDLTLNIGHYTQLYPVHYQNKEFVTDELIKTYEKKLGI